MYINTLYQQPTIINSLQNTHNNNSSVKRIVPTLISPLTTNSDHTFDPISFYLYNIFFII